LKLKSFNVLRLKQYFNLFLFTVQYIKYTMTFWIYIKILIVWWIYWHVNIFLLQGFKFYISIKLLSSTYLFIYSINFQNTVWYFNITSGVLRGGGERKSILSHPPQAKKRTKIRKICDNFLISPLFTLYLPLFLLIIPYPTTFPIIWWELSLIFYSFLRVELTLA